jgi:hypothetical protein
MSHSHDATGGPDDGAVDWFRYLDVLVWVSVALIAAIALEWLLGYIVREQITRGADRYRARVAAGKLDQE